jgi:hypothetical protein
MTPQIRKLMLTAHIVSTVGWMGAIAAFLALGIAGLTSHEARIVDSAYIAMNLIGWRVIVPLGILSLLTGLIQSLGTAWGLFRHYWVLLKLALTVVATILLLRHMTLSDRLADSANETAVPGSHLHSLRLQLTADAAAGVLLLIVNTVLSVYKPRGMTRYGLRKQHEEIRDASSETAGLDRGANAPRWVKVFGIAGLLSLLLFRVVILHVSAGHAHHFH